MIRAIRPNAMAQDDASLVSGWNVAPNLAYTLRLLPGSSSCGVLLYDEDGSTLVATGAALVGTAQPCVLIPQTDQTISMVDADLGWHLLLTTAGTESQRTIRIGPAVDLPDEIHPVYGDDDLALSRATAAIDAAAHYIDDVTITCPLGLGAGLGDVVSVPVDGVAVVSITWTATPDGTMEQTVIRRHVAIAPDAFVEVTPPTVANDTGTATHLVGTSGNVLANDDAGLTVAAVNGLTANVGTAVDGDNGGSFTVNADGSWTFNPAGDFALLEGPETADTSVTYHASDGTADAMATLTVTVSHANTVPVAVDDTGTTTADATTSGNVLTNDTDADADSLSVSQVSGSPSNVGVAVAGNNGGLFTIGIDGSWTFDPSGDFAALTGEQTATTSVTYHVSDGVAEDEGTLTVMVSAASASLFTLAEITTAQWLDADDISTLTVSSGVIGEWRDKSGNNRHVSQETSSSRPAYTENTLNGKAVASFNNKSLQNSTTQTECVHHVFYVTHNPTSINSGCEQTTSGICLYNNNNGALVYADQGCVGESISIGAIGAFCHRSGNIHNILYHTADMSNGHIVHFDWQTRSPSLYLDGSFIKTGLTAPQTAHFRFNVCPDHYGTYYGNIAEKIIIIGALSVENRQRIEGYLAHKWGLTAGLPSNHPYKSAAPTI